MARGVIERVVLGVWLGCVTVAAAQLPPEIMIDRYLLRAERMMEAKDPKGALELMGKIVALQKEHSLTLPEEFHFKHAQMALSAGAVQEAIDAVSKYLVEAGRAGKFYREALELLEEAEQVQGWFDPEQTCAGKSEGAECWNELTDQPGCYVWDDSLIVDQTVTWTGECSGGRAQGEGTLKREEGEITSESSTGNLTDGRKQGEWVERLGYERVEEGPYEDGKRQGNWVFRYYDNVSEGWYEANRKHGYWVERYGDGQIDRGSYVEGEKDGQWTERWKDGAAKLVTFEKGKRLKVASAGNPSQDGSATAGGAQPVSTGLRVGETVVFDGMEFVGIPPGEFLMGSTSRHARDDEQPVTQVKISKGFYLGKYEVTEAEWQAVMGDKPPADAGFGSSGGNCPVVLVSWEMVQDFIRKLNGMSGRGRYRLPTEAEWEYAARAGTRTDTYAGDITDPDRYDPILNGIAWHLGIGSFYPHPVGKKAPNPWGLYDMLGNVWEWVGDWYGDYSGGSVTDPGGPVSGAYRVIRGGARESRPSHCRSAARDGSRYGSEYVGFRLLREQ